MAFTIKPYPEWSWSQSRDGLFRECIRKYYYYYYASHNGWLRDSDPESQAAYRLKQISNLYLLLGDAVHQMAESALKSWRDCGSLTEKSEMILGIRSRLNQAYKDSLQVKQWKAAPKKLAMLHEMYYGGGLSPQRVGQIKERIEACVDGFLSSRSLVELQGVDGIEIKEIEELNQFYISGEKIHVKLDMLYQKADGTWIIADWKTGLESDKNEQQMLLYALFLHDQYKVPYDRIEIRLEYLLSRECVTPKIAIEEVERIEAEVMDSIRQMKAYLEDPVRNIPLPKEAFPPNPGKKTCSSCSFLEICAAKTV
ncbi:PD-(D/E)XK nuclease family protein [Ferviditalea candida]|uniref:PD-(D/E)XK nuclease family protein n=1 Tax=Ferviditalea candida TaxID=3108399 RepID=A0ABU5ZHC2_9BACL|nr:PD-(D/E)XK nuclease family protein [Paenibacillaceae bacterium T2]